MVVPSSSKQIVVVVDTSYQLQPHFNEILTAYLTPLLGQLVDKEQQGQTKGSGGAEFGLVVFGSSGPSGDYSVRACPFSKDYKEFRSWLNTVPFGPAACTGWAEATAPLAEALCAALKLSTLSECPQSLKEQYIILVTNRLPSDTPCHDCLLMGSYLDHGQRIGKANIQLSVLSPSNLPQFHQLFEKSKPAGDVPSVTRTAELLQLLRGVSVAPQPSRSKAMEPGGPVPPSGSMQLPGNGKGASQPQIAPGEPQMLWEGILTWQQSAQTASAAPFCELSAFPSALRPEADPSAFAASEWPQTLTVSGVCNSKDPLITQQFKNALVVEFVPKKIQPSKSEIPYKNFFVQLLSKTWAAVIYLKEKTLLILPHNHGDSQKLIGLLIPKLTLAPRSAPAMETSASKLPSKPTAPSQIQAPSTKTTNRFPTSTSNSFIGTTSGSGFLPQNSNSSQSQTQFLQQFQQQRSNFTQFGEKKL